jgi:hypothetical protein
VENFEFEIKIYDIDKYAPQQIIEYLNERWPKKNRLWFYLIMVVCILFAFWFLYIIYGYMKPNKPVEKTNININAITTTWIVNSTGIIQNITPVITTKIETWEIQKSSIIAIEQGTITQKDLDIIFCKKDNESLSRYNDELLADNNKIQKENEVCVTDLNNLKEKSNINTFFYAVGQKISEKCKSPADEKVKANCSELINNYYNNVR